MHTTVTAGRMDPASIDKVSMLFADYDAVPDPRTGARRRQLFTYHTDLWLHIEDFDDDTTAVADDPDPRTRQLQQDLAPFVAAFDPATGDTPFDARSSRYYHWLPAPLHSGTHSTVVVNRLAPRLQPAVAGLFADFDTTDVPHLMGTRRRQLFAYHGVYFHIQDFDGADGAGVIDQAWRTAHPRFIQICADLDPLIAKYDPHTWREPADALATRFYRWEAAS